MRAHRATSARSPSGRAGSSSESPCSLPLLASGRPYLHAGATLLLLGRPEFLARLRELDRDPLDPGDDLVERLSHAEIAAEPVEAAPLPHESYRLVGIV